MLAFFHTRNLARLQCGIARGHSFQWFLVYGWCLGFDFILLAYLIYYLICELVHFIFTCGTDEAYKNEETDKIWVLTLATLTRCDLAVSTWQV